MKLLQLGKCHQRNNKRGGMLVIVLMIFAVSLILISSAMTITLSSRSRYYVDTERSQERLTLTCAAEAVVDAIETQEITDEQIKQMSNNPDVPYEITGASKTSVKAGAAATSGKDIAPGLAGVSGNQTYMYVKPAGGGSEDIDLEFVTKIVVTGDNDKAEKLHVHLKYTPPTEPKKICQNMVTCGEDGSYNNIPKLTMNSEESFTVFHGDVALSDGSGSYIHNPVVITGTVTGGSGTKYHNDIIFYGPNAGVRIPSDGNGVTINSGEGDFFFLGVKNPVTNETGKQNVFKNTSGGATNGTGMNMIADAAYFYNANMTTVDWTLGGGKTKYWVVGKDASVSRPTVHDGEENVVIKDGGTANISSVKTTVYDSIDDVTDNNAKTAYNRLKTKASKYINGGDLKAAASSTIPTAAEQYAAFKDFTTGTMITQHSGDISLDGNKAYQMSGTYKNGVCTIDLSKGDASIYISGDVLFSIYRIEVSNSTKHKLTIVMAPGTKFEMKDNYASEWPASGAAGIVSCDARHCSHSDLTNNAYADLHANEGQEPACMIIGLGKNTLSAGRANVMDAYISLAGTGTDASTVVLKDKVNFYGRFESVFVDTGNSDNLTMDHCPGIGEGSNTPTPLTSCYTAEIYDYHY